MSPKLLIVFSVLVVAAYAVKPYIGFPESKSGLSNRIVNGVDAKKGEFPHQVLLHYTYPDESPIIHTCGGVIIDSQWILTAGHCPPYKSGYNSFIVKAGKHDIYVTEPTEQIIDVASFYIHESYVGGVAPYDIALLKLKTPLKLNEAVNVISLPKAGSKHSGMSILSGWGSDGSHIVPRILKKAQLPIVDFATCESTLMDIVGFSPLHETNVCTGSLTGDVSACDGDSGGPLIAKNASGVYEVIGLSSWVVLPCGTKGAPSVHTGVANFIDWIHSTMENH